MQTLFLETIAAAIDATLDDNLDQPLGLLVRGAGEEIATRDLEGIHPVSALQGFVAPEEWEFLGVISTGNASHMDSGEAMGRVRAIAIVARDGSSWSAYRFSDGTTHSAEGAVGRVANALRLAMGVIA